MLSIDFLISFSFMGLLFLRQVYILRQPNKINYAPLMLSIGFIASIIHFITHPEITDTVVLVRESLYPLLVSLILFIIMNIMHQTLQSEIARTQERFIKVLVSELSQLKEFILELEKRMAQAQLEDREAQAELIAKFKGDLRALETIQENQMKFLDMFDTVENSLKDVQKGYKYFSEVQLPELDGIVHKHIDILRVAEQDHYNKLKNMIAKAMQGYDNFDTEIESLRSKIVEVHAISKDISSAVVKHTVTKLAESTKEFERELQTLKSYTESLQIALHEDENIIVNIRSNSEIVLKQMRLMADKIEELESRKGDVDEFYTGIKELISELERIKYEYFHAQKHLSALSEELIHTKDTKVAQMKENLDELSRTLSQKIDDSLEKLHEHYHITSNDLSQSVQALVKKAQLQKGYGVDQDS